MTDHEDSLIDGLLDILPAIVSVGAILALGSLLFL